MKKYSDFYGCSATVSAVRTGGYRLTVRTSFGKRFWNKVYKTERGVKAAMNRLSDGWVEQGASQ